MFFRGHNRFVYAVWAVLAVAMIVAIVTGHAEVAYVAFGTFLLTLVPIVFFRRFQIEVPVGFLMAIMLFIFGTIFLGEAVNFYERFWWWDVALHGVSALGFGLIGFFFVFMLFEGDRYAAPPLAIAFIAFCFAVTIGTGWEIFEFLMDEIFGLNMQKSGLPDTMWDLIVDAIGASIGGWVGYFTYAVANWAGYRTQSTNLSKRTGVCFVNSAESEFRMTFLASWCKARGYEQTTLKRPDPRLAPRQSRAILETRDSAGIRRERR